jgi:hypothetical protein
MRQLVSVYRDAEIRTDCSNGGISARFVRLLAVTPDELDPDMPMLDEFTPVAVLTESVRGYPVLRPHPALLRGGPRAWTSFGGNFASSSDSRFLDAVEDIAGFRARAVPIHDREEP